MLVNDSDSAQQTLTAVLVSQPTHGQLTFNADGSFSYTPYANICGTDKFTYMATDGHGGTAIATVILYIPLSPTPNLSAGIAHAGNFTTGDVGDTYTIVVSNTGDFAATGTVSLTDTLPIGLTATAFSGDGWTVDLATLTATRSDPLAPSASYPPLTLTVNVADDAPASVTDTATVSGGGEQNTLNGTVLDPTTILQVRIWDGGGDNNNWSNPANWEGGVAPTAGYQLVFAGNTRQSTVNDFPAGTLFDEITFTSSGFTLSGNGVTLNPQDGTAINDVGSQDTIALPITLDTDCTFEVTGAGALNLAAVATLDTGSYYVTVDCDADSIGSQWANDVVGSGGLTKTGAGVLTLTGASTYSGDTTFIEDGTLVVAGGDNRLPTWTAIVLGSGDDNGVLQLGDGSGASNQTIARLFTSGDGNGNRVVGGAGDDSRLTIDDDYVDSSYCWPEFDQFGGILGGPGENQNHLALTTYVGSCGPLMLTGANTYAGGTTLVSGILGTWGSDTAFGTGPIYLAGGALGGYDATLANDIVALDSTSSTIFPVGTLTLNGNISGSGAITCTNPTYDDMSDGVLELGGNNGKFTGTFYQWEDSGVGTMTTYFTSASAGSENATWQIDGGVLANEVSGTPIIALGVLTGSGGTLSNALAGSRATYQVGGNDQSTEFDGVIEDGSGTVALTKVGTGRLTLAGANTYTDVTTIESGTLQIDKAMATINVLTNAGGLNNTGGSLILDYSANGISVGSTVQSLLQTAYNNGTNSFRTGQIRDTSASRSISLGWVDNSSTRQVTIMPVLCGDANLSGQVTGQDLITLLANYNGPGNWSQGDFNYDGMVTGADLVMLAAYYGQTLPSGELAAASLVVASASADGMASGRVAAPATSSGTEAAAPAMVSANSSVAIGRPADGVSESQPTAPRSLSVPVSAGQSTVPAAASPAAPPSSPLTLPDLKPVVTEAIARRADAGLNAATPQKLPGVAFDIGDLPGSSLGEAAGNRIYRDTNAAANGWLVGSTPAWEEVFTPSQNKQPLPAVDPPSWIGWT